MSCCARFALVFRLVCARCPLDLRFFCATFSSCLRFICDSFLERLRLMSQTCAEHLRFICDRFFTVLRSILPSDCPNCERFTPDLVVRGTRAIHVHTVGLVMENVRVRQRKPGSCRLLGHLPGHFVRVEPRQSLNTWLSGHQSGHCVRIAFQEGTVKHVYFIAETKGSMSSMELRKIEECKIDCARKFFSKITSDQVKYDVVNSYGKLMELVK